VAFARFVGWMIAALAVLAVLVPAFLPDTYHVERSELVDASPATIHRLVGDLRQWDRWAPWKEEDPTIETRVTVPAGVGAHQAWTGDSGDGELTLTDWDPDTGIAYDMAFDHGAHVSTGAIRYAREGGGTRVTWSMDGKAGGWFGRYFVAMMDRMVGPMFERGLGRLSAAAETLPAEAPGPEEDRADPAGSGTS
jgi:carbon monoxide dehydrogenase subunit G